MGRAKTILQSEFPYNITARCINREWFTLDMEIVWTIFCEELFMVSKIHDLKIHSFVLMNNHFHLIASTPEANISQCTHRLMGNVSRRLNESGNRINETFAGRHFKTILHTQAYFMNAYKYNYRNPLASGLYKKVEDYPYSTLHGLLGKSHLLIPIAEDDLLFSNVESTLGWLNTEPSPNDLESVRKALRRPFFEFKNKRRVSRVLLESSRLSSLDIRTPSFF